MFDLLSRTNIDRAIMSSTLPHYLSIKKLNDSDPTFNENEHTVSHLRRSAGIGADIESDSIPSYVRKIEDLNNSDPTFNENEHTVSHLRRSAGLGADIESDSLDHESRKNHFFTFHEIGGWQKIGRTESLVGEEATKNGR